MKKLSIVCFAVVLFLMLAACSGGDGSVGGNVNEPSGPGDSSKDNGEAADKTKLVVWLWPGMGIEELMQEYADQHNIELEIQTSEFAAVHTNLQTAFAAGSGAPDIAGVEIGYIDKFKSNPEHFHNLLDYGADEVADHYLDWKWEQTMTADQSAVLGLPTDIGPMALVYRSDVFAAAGLPTDRDEVTQLLQTWDDFIEAGVQIREQTGAAMVDDASLMYGIIVDQGDSKYFDRDNNLIIEDNSQVKKAWDITMKAIQAGITAGMEDGTPEQIAALQNGDTAVVLAPAWEMTSIKRNAPDTNGLWDIAQIPEGSGNQGGSFLTIPKQSKNAELAYGMIEWVLSPEQQLHVFTTLGNFPSTPDVYDSDEFIHYSDEFFSNAPVGQIYGDAAESIQPVWEGPHNQMVEDAMSDAVVRVETGQQSPEDSWNQAIADIKRQLARQ